MLAGMHCVRGLLPAKILLLWFIVQDHQGFFPSRCGIYCYTPPCRDPKESSRLLLLLRKVGDVAILLEPHQELILACMLLFLWLVANARSHDCSHLLAPLPVVGCFSEDRWGLI